MLDVRTWPRIPPRIVQGSAGSASRAAQRSRFSCMEISYSVSSALRCDEESRFSGSQTQHEVRVRGMPLMP